MNIDHPDKKSIIMYVSAMYEALSKQKETESEGSELEQQVINYRFKGYTCCYNNWSSLLKILILTIVSCKACTFEFMHNLFAQNKLCIKQRLSSTASI